ncbi:MAG: phage baseplate assembly protein V [Desulfobacterales bacterium]|nr:phage baseplate assembly protein V [Desulfobacterales bacterium]
MDQGLEKLYQLLSSKRYGKYRATVVDREDPEGKGRLRLLIPAVLGDQESDWALPCFAGGGISDAGSITIPEVDAHVWVEFEAGDPSLPIWTGTFFGRDDDLPQEARITPPDAHVVKTPKGSVFTISDEDGCESIQLKHYGGQQIDMDAAGNVTIENAQGETIALDAENQRLKCEDRQGNAIELDGSSITIKEIAGAKITLKDGSVKIEGAGEITLDAMAVNLGGAGGEGVIKGQSFMGIYAGHTHPTSMGPSGPPIPMGEFSTISFTVKST